MNRPKRWIFVLPDGTLHPAMILADGLRDAVLTFHEAAPGQRAEVYEKSDPATRWLVWGLGATRKEGGYP